MEKIILDKFGCQVVEKENRLFIRFDSGQFASKIIEYEITEKEANKVSISEYDAYQVIIEALERNMVEEIILKDYGWCQVIQRFGKYFIKYDAGGIVVQMREMEVNKKKANIAMKNQIKAEEIIKEMLQK